MDAAAAIEHIRDEIGHEDARANEDLRAPARRVHFEDADGTHGQLTIVAEDEAEAAETFEEFADEDEEITWISPTDEEVETMAEEDEFDLPYSHLHRSRDRRKRWRVEEALLTIRGEDSEE